MKLEELEVYKLAMQVGDAIWDIEEDWDTFTKKIIGNQMVRSADSIAANLSGDYGRYFFKENRQFCYYNRGSLYELRTWLEKAHTRGLINEDKYITHIDILERHSVKLNNYIKSIGTNYKK